MFWIIVPIVLCFGECLFAAEPGKRIPNFAGPYRAVFRTKLNNRSEEFDSTRELWSDISVSHDLHRGELQYFWGRTVTRVPFDDNLQIQVNMATRSNNEWKKNAFVMTFRRACSDALSSAPTLVHLLFGDDWKKCPLMPRDIILKNQTFDMRFPPVRVFPYGRYRLTAIVYRGLQAIGVFVTEIDVVPKI